jgi:hypothetical protein
LELEINLRGLGLALLLILLLVGGVLGFMAFRTIQGLRHQVAIERQAREDSELLVQRLQEEALAMKRDDFYLVIDRGRDQFEIRKRDKLIKEGPCATGRGERWFKDIHGHLKKWEFDTPTGERKILAVEANPRWNRPDWDWLERGKKPPEPEDEIEISSDLSPEAALAYYRSLSKEEREEVRSVPGHLGAWKLSMGDGYYIHAGNLAGGHVSHGCVRVTPQDLSVIHELIPVGSSVFIY